ncbi:peptidoglycan recognition protein [Streptomyces sp. NPDC001380]|uniref:peptidoglycan recognition protein family protein n=1 Tax=Streptomyces sp. NPDC001380 TaxID=3364566 RepID=UPI0036D0DACE
MRLLRTARFAAACAVTCAAALGLTALAGCAAPDAALRHPATTPAAGVSGASYAVPLTSAPTAGPSAAPRRTRPFSMVGAVWNDARAPLDATVRIRTRRSADGRWGPWTVLQAEDRVDPDPGRKQARGYTSPLWVGPSDGVQVAVGRPVGGVLPAGLHLALVDPGGPGDPARQPPVAGGPPGWLLLPTAAAPHPRRTFTAPRPAIVTRAGWRADESLRHRTSLVYAGAVHMVFIHHTDNPNGYSCSQVPDMIRAMYQYHVAELAWDDIGYNFLVDRCGTIYEGRAGGVDRPVVGGHTMGFNIGSMGIAAIGDFRAGHPVPKPMADSIARLAAWKLSLAGVDPAGRATMVSQDSATRYAKGTAVRLAAISGHRDAVWTECPGDSLYAALPGIRAAAARIVAAARARALAHPH